MSEISDILNALKFGQVHQLDIELTPEQSADLLTHIDDLHFAVNEQPELTARIAELEAERRWIPVSERLPDNWESVLTIDISKSTRDAVTAFYNPETSRWSTHSAGDLWVTHWMPLPEPPIVYGKVRG